jgi:hypothetical protein
MVHAMKIFSAYITLLGCVGWGIVAVFQMFTVRRVDMETFLILISVIIPSASGFFLILSQKLYARSELEKVKEQHEILKLKIEMAKLSTDLETKIK